MANNDPAIMKLDADAGRLLLKKLVIDAYPELANPAVNPFEAANMVRRWVSTNFPVGRTTDVYADSIFHNIVACLAGRGSMLCGGIAHILGYCYGLFGLPSVIYNYGIMGTFTHVVTLVSVNGRGWGGGGWNTYVQDALFNVTYVSRTGAPLRFQDICGFLKEGREEDVVMAADNGEKILASPNFDMTDALNLRTVECAEHRRQSFGVHKRLMAESAAAGEWFSRHGVPNSPMYALLSRLTASFPRGPFMGDTNLLAQIMECTIAYDTGK